MFKGFNEENILWLKNNTSLWNIVVEKWINTFNFRYTSLHNKEQHIFISMIYQQLKVQLAFN